MIIIMWVKVILVVITHFGRSSNALKGSSKSWKLGDESRPTKLLHINRPEYWEESWRPKEICCRSDSSERPSAKAGVKKTQIKIIIMSLQQNWKKLWNPKLLVNSNRSWESWDGPRKYIRISMKCSLKEELNPFRPLHYQNLLGLL